VVVLTPYVGQLMEIRRQLATSGTKVLLNDRDLEVVAEMDEEGASLPLPLVLLLLALTWSGNS
jgi:hypothetical protein